MCPCIIAINSIIGITANKKGIVLISNGDDVFSIDGKGRI